MPLDTDTLVVVQVSISLIVALLLIGAAASADALPAQRQWAAGNALLCVAFVVGADWNLPLWVHGGLNYGLTALSLGLILRGLFDFCGRAFAARWVWAFGAAALLMALYFGYVHPSLLARRVGSGLLFGMANLYCAYVLLRFLSGEARRAAYPCIVGFSAMGLILLERAWYWSFPEPLPATFGILANEQFQKNFFFLAVPLAQVVIGFGLIAMVAYRHAAMLMRLSQTDTLTQVYNRAAVDPMGGQVVERARRTHTDVAVAMVDADHFKAINDTHGHAIGDEVLKHMVRFLSAALRAEDLVVRYGGEEFMILFDGSSVATAAKVAERIRAAIEASSLEVGGETIRYTVSIGVAGSEEGEYELRRLIDKADARLYEAKRAGRNQVRAA